jgi:hypothetical protein
MFFWRLGLVAKSKVGKLDRDGILLRLHSARAASASSLPVSNTRSYLVLPSASFVRFSATDDDRRRRSTWLPRFSWSRILVSLPSCWSWRGCGHAAMTLASRLQPHALVHRSRSMVRACSRGYEGVPDCRILLWKFLRCRTDATADTHSPFSDSWGTLN